jgi:hypothetical protein
MYRRTAATAALTAAGLVAVAPLASAAETPKAPTDGGNGNVQLLNGLNVLPVQACGLGIPILSGILDSPDGTCTVGNEGADVNGN